MVASAEKNADVVTPARKAAILMLALDQETAARIMRKLSRDRVEDITREIAEIDRVPPAIRTRIISEFYNMLLARRYVDMGGLNLAKNLLEKSLPADDARKIMESLEHQVHQQPFSFLQKSDTEHLLMFLQSEHPQTIALVLSHVPSAMSAEILVGLPPDRQIQVIRRIAAMDQTSPEVIKEVERGLEKRIAGMGGERLEKTGGVKAVAEILNLAGRATEKTIMDGLAEETPDLVEDIRRLMFVFEDIINVDDRGIQAVLKEVDNEQLTLALKTASDALKEKIFKNMSERSAQLIKEEMGFMGPVRVSDVEAAQQKVVDIVRRLEESGEIVIMGKGSEADQLV